MKKIFTAIAFAVALFTALPSQAQVKFGLKGGYNVTNMSISSEVIDKSNQTGWFVGPTAKITLPIVGLGVDIAALYDQREAKMTIEGTNESQTVSEKNINIPINVRYSFGLGDLASVYAAVGPQFGFNVGAKNYSWTNFDNYELKKSNFSVNLGVGACFANHLEVGCNYNIACGKTGEATVKDALGTVLTSKKNRTNAWQIYLAYYF